MSNELEALLKEKRVFNPSTEIIEGSNIKKWMDKHNLKDYDELQEKSLENPQWFWNEIAGELEWFQLYKKVLKWDPPNAEWFLYGKTNIVQNALFRHIVGPHKDKIAFIWVG